MKAQLTFCAVAGMVFFVQSQNSPVRDSLRAQKLEEVVVTDSKIPLKRENSGKNIITITASELARRAGEDLPQIINTKSGIEVNGSRGQAGQNTSVYAAGEITGKCLWSSMAYR